MSGLPASVPLIYTIAQATPHSGSYVPENVLVDKPTDSASRWSGAHQGTNVKQWILLCLEIPAILKSITFGKLHKPHPCNMKDFKVYVGLTENSMMEVLHTGLKNDSIPETFPLKHINPAGICLPTQFIKIVPVSPHAQNFHVSIWHVSMTGISDPIFVGRVLQDYQEYRETTALKHILKHLRQRRLLTPFHSILSRASLQFEHPLITQLHNSLVLNGNFNTSESLLQRLSASGLFSDHLSSSPPYAIWRRLDRTKDDGDVPCPRGGHATCIDPVNEMIYLFGGWDGERSLDDFWVYSIKEERWRMLSHSTAKENNAPGPRSCHKMVFDTKSGSVYLLGRLNDTDGARSGATAASRDGRRHQSSGDGEEARTPTPRSYCSEFYRYHTRGADKGQWDFLTFDTASSGGPPLVFDHQMVMDCDAQILYVFGGRVVDGDWENSKYSGLYSYDVRRSKWRLLQHSDGAIGSQSISPRFGHSMVLDPKTKTLFIFAGQKDDKYLSDMYAYDIATNTATELFSNFTAAGGPEACFTQRAVIDPERQEIYVFCGLTRASPSSSQNTLRSYSSNWVYRYGTRPGQWSQILRQPESASTPTTNEMPVPRFAHQVVYNPNSQKVFMHGGNAGGLSLLEGPMASGKDADGDGGADGDEVREGTREQEKDVSNSDGKERRLDDFWTMELRRPGPEEIIRQATFRIRRQQFREMSEEQSPVKALQFLQTEVSKVVDHSNAAEEELFRSLLTHLLSGPIASSPTPNVIVPKVVVKSASASSDSPTDASASSNTRPLKRSRTETSDNNGTWTNRLSDDDDTSAPNSPTCSSGICTTSLRSFVDPIELQDGGDADKKATSPPSATRFAERSEVFESLLEFISEGDKEPSGSLLDLVDQEWGEDDGRGD